TSKLKKSAKTIETVAKISVVIIGYCYILYLLLKCAASDPEDAKLFLAFAAVLSLTLLFFVSVYIELNSGFNSEKEDVKEKTEKDNIYSCLDNEKDLFTHKKNSDWEEDLFTHKEDSINSDLTVHSTISYYYNYFYDPTDPDTIHYFRSNNF
ncbi:MAG: hypothetical protein ACP5KH_05285, partial [Thermodesulfovibrio sp.]